EPHAVVDQPLLLGRERGPEEGEERAHLGCGPRPVVAREGEERERANTEAGRRLHDPPDGACASAVARGAREAARRGPAAVAVHDDGDVKLALGYINRSTFHGKVSPQKKRSAGERAARGA